MKIFALTAVALLVAAPALAVTKLTPDQEAARIAAERNDAWHIKHLGPPKPADVVIESQPAPDVPTSAVPEPGTWAMMIAGFGVIGLAMRRRALARTAA